MFSLLQRILRHALNHPKSVLAVALAVTLLSIYPVRNLKWELRLIDMLPDSSEVKRTDSLVTDNFGGFGTLTAIISSPDSALNGRLSRELSEKLDGNRYVNFTEYESDLDFFERNKLLYIHTSDLRKIRDEVARLKAEFAAEYNPLYVNLLSADSMSQTVKDSIANAVADSLSLSKLENRYLSTLRGMHSNADGTVRIVNIFPKRKISDLSASRKLSRIVEGTFESLPESERAELHLTGAVYETASEGWRILPEARSTGILLSIILAVFLLFRFARQPTIFLLSVIPVALVFIWTLAAAWLFFGRINLYSLVLSVILPGISCREIVHLMTRFAEERRKGLGYELSLESALLGIGPTIAVSAFSFAGAFLGLLFVPLAGMQELGVLGAVGSVLNWFLSSLVFPALIEVSGRYKSFLSFGRIRAKLEDFKERPFVGIKKAAVPVILLSAILPCRGIYPNFDYDFSHIEYNPETAVADSLLKETGYLSFDPIAVVLPNADAAGEFFNRATEEMDTNAATGIRSVAIFRNLLPSNQKEKLELLGEIRSGLDLEMLKRFIPADSAKIRRIIDDWNTVPVNSGDLPKNLRRIFGADKDSTEFAFIFPNFNPDDGLACRRLNAELKFIDYPKTGTALVRAEILDRTLPHFHKAILFGAFCVFLLTFLFYKKIAFSLFTLVSPLIAFFWLLSLLRLLGMELSAYSSLAFPILIGMSIDGSIQMWNAYYERSTGSIYSILRSTGVTCFFAEILTIVVLCGLLFSSHPGIHDIGVISILGVVCIALSHTFVFPLLAGCLERRRIRRRNLP